MLIANPRNRALLGVWLRLCVAFTPMLLGGCTTYQARPLDPQEFMESFGARTLDDAGLRTFIAGNRLTGLPAPEWNLSQLTLAALYFSPELDVARARWRTSRAAVLTAAQIPNPSLKFSVGRATNPPTGESPRTVDVGIDFPIETGRKRRYRTARAEFLSEAARLDVRNVAWQARSRVRSRLLDWYAAGARAAVLENDVEVRQSIAAMLGKRLALGAASSTEENQARIAFTQGRVDLASARRQIDEAKSRLAAAIGLPAIALETIRVRFDEFDRDRPTLDAGTIRRDAVLNRADLLAALAEYAAGESALRTEIAKQYPDLQLGPAYTFDMGINKFALGVSNLALPIFNRNEGPIAEARAHRAELAAKFEALQAKVIGEVDQALQADDSARRQLALADSLLEAERSQFERVKHSFAADEVDRLALALAAHALHAAELAQRDASTKAREAIGKLEDAAQRPIVGEPTDVDLEFAPRGAKP